MILPLGLSPPGDLEQGTKVVLVVAAVKVEVEVEAAQLALALEVAPVMEALVMEARTIMVAMGPVAEEPKAMDLDHKVTAATAMDLETAHLQGQAVEVPLAVAAQVALRLEVKEALKVAKVEAVQGLLVRPKTPRAPPMATLGTMIRSKEVPRVKVGAQKVKILEMMSQVAHLQDPDQAPPDVQLQASGQS
jgi:hypothetical protein